MVKFSTDFCGLNVWKGEVECEFFVIICFYFLLVYENMYYLQVYLDDCAYKMANMQMIDSLHDNLFKSDRN